MTTEQLKIIALEERLARLEALLAKDRPEPAVSIADFEAAMRAFALRGDSKPLEDFYAAGGTTPTPEAWDRWAAKHLSKPGPRFPGKQRSANGATTVGFIR